MPYLTGYRLTDETELGIFALPWKNRPRLSVGTPIRCADLKAGPPLIYRLFRRMVAHSFYIFLDFFTLIHGYSENTESANPRRQRSLRCCCCWRCRCCSRCWSWKNTRQRHRGANTMQQQMRNMPPMWWLFQFAKSFSVRFAYALNHFNALIHKACPLVHRVFIIFHDVPQSI